MKDIRNFKKNTKNNNPDQNKETNYNKINELSGKNESELMSELMNAIYTGKEDGTFNNEMLKNFIDTVSPMLSDDQSKRLKDISEAIKNN